MTSRPVIGPRLPVLLVLGVLAPAALVAEEASAGASFDDAVGFFVDDYCRRCHGRRSPRADLSLVAFESKGDVLEERAVWKKVLDAVEGFEMPPKDRDQPTREERAALVAWIRSALAEPQFGELRDPGRPVLRRLTRLEYNNTVRDLLGLETDVFLFSERLPFDKAYFVPSQERMPDRLDVPAREYGAKYPVLLPDAGLPGDSRAEHGFTNRGDAQDISSVRLGQYLTLAQQIFEHPEILERAERLQEIFPHANFRPQVARDRNRKARIEVEAVQTLASNGNVARTAEGSARDLETFRELLASAFEENRGGVYTGTGSNSTVPGKGGLLRVVYGVGSVREVVINPSEDVWNAAFATAEESSGELLFTNKEKRLKQFFFGFERGDNRPDLEIAEVGVVVLSRRGQQGVVEVGVEFHDGASSNVRVELAEGAGKGNTFVSFRAPDTTSIRRLKIDGSEFTGDYVLLDDLAFVTRDPPERTPAVVGRELPGLEGQELPDEVEEIPEPARTVAIDPSIAKKPPRERLAHFMKRAFRRPISTAEVDSFLALYDASRESGADDEAAMKVALRAVLASPSFLYLVEREEPGGEAVRALDGHELAARLSYFLWSSMPDDELFRLAASDELTRTDVLAAQARRMLRDPRARELSESFFVEWLKLRELWSAQPDRSQFQRFYSGPKGKRTLARDMFAEALLLFETLLVENRSVLELIDTEETWVNRRLADLYGLDSVPDTDDRYFHRVDLEDSERGGILTMAATLTLTSFPERTSPIRRGAWILETIYNRPPPPPAIAVADLDKQEDLDPDLPLRKKVELHRAEAACAVCHDRIDPPGFALENFDAIGAWREEDGDAPIDPSGVLIDGRAFDGPGAFKAALLKDRERFVRGFVEHLLSYALGRELEHFDDATVDEVIRAAEPDGFRLKSIIVEIVRSPTFRHVRDAATIDSDGEK